MKFKTGTLTISVALSVACTFEDILSEIIFREFRPKMIDPLFVQQMILCLVQNGKNRVRYAQSSFYFLFWPKNDLECAYLFIWTKFISNFRLLRLYRTIYLHYE